MSYPIESIPDDNVLFMWVHKINLDIKNEPLPIAFQPKPHGTTKLSTQWDKYSTPEKCKNSPKEPFKNGVGKFDVGAVRKLQFNVNHSPSTNNRSHSDISEVSEEQHRVQLKKCFKMLLYPDKESKL